jgi:transglutaminase-like putative cysteine protease
VFTVAARRPDYWKAEDLDMFDGYGWVSASVNAPPLPPPAPDLLARWSQTIDVSVIGLRSTAVIAAGLAEVPTLPGRTTLGGNAEGTWGSDPPLGPGSQYTVQTYSPRPSPGQLSRAGTRYPAQNLAPYLSLSVPIGSGPAPAVTQIQFAAFHQPARAASPMLTRMIGPSPYGPVYALARRLAAGTRTPYAYAVAVSRYLSAHYTYNENPPARRYPLVSFLFHDKIGYCQQFSGAMAMLLRMGGVPARVAAGFTTGSRDAHGRFQVTDIDAHAWVEAWFPHYGWVRFDPTPGIAPARGGTPPAGILKTLPGSIGPARAAPRRDAGASAAAATSGQHRHSSGMSPWLLLPAGLLVVLGGLLFALVIAPEPGPDEQLRELERALARTGRPIGPEVTLVALEHRFRDSPSAAGYIRALRLSRYAGLTPPAVPGGRPALREQLREGLGVTGRLRALWALPPRPGLGRRVGRGRPTSH